MPLTYFKCVDTLLAYCNKSIPANQKNRPFGLRLRLMPMSIRPASVSTTTLCPMKSRQSTLRIFPFCNVCASCISNFVLCRWTLHRVPTRNAIRSSKNLSNSTRRCTIIGRSMTTLWSMLLFPNVRRERSETNRRHKRNS